MKPLLPALLALALLALALLLPATAEARVPMHRAIERYAVYQSHKLDTVLVQIGRCKRSHRRLTCHADERVVLTDETGEVELDLEISYLVLAHRRDDGCVHVSDMDRSVRPRVYCAREPGLFF